MNKLIPEAADASRQGGPAGSLMGPELLAQWRANNPGQPDPILSGKGPTVGGGGRFSPGGSHDQMVAQQNQRANNSYNAQVAAGGHQEYFQKFGGTSISGRAGYEANKAAMDADNANRQVIANAQQKRLSGNPGAAVGYRDTVTAPGASRPAGLSGLSSQAKPSMSQAPQMAPGGLNSLAAKAKKPRNITLNQMYRK